MRSESTLVDAIIRNSGVPPRPNSSTDSTVNAASEATVNSARSLPERRVLVLGVDLSNPQVTVFLNRTSDLLWLMARDEEGA